jgi:hypothetical protein
LSPDVFFEKMSENRQALSPKFRTSAENINPFQKYGLQLTFRLLYYNTALLEPSTSMSVYKKIHKYMTCHHNFLTCVVKGKYFQYFCHY